MFGYSDPHVITVINNINVAASVGLLASSSLNQQAQDRICSTEVSSSKLLGCKLTILSGLHATLSV